MSKCNSLFQDKQEEMARGQYEAYCGALLKANRLDIMLSFEEFCSDSDEPTRDSDNGNNSL